MNELLKAVIIRLECIAGLLAADQGKQVEFTSNGYTVYKPSRPTKVSAQIMIDDEMRLIDIGGGDK